MEMKLRWLLLAVVVMVAVFTSGARAWGEEFEADEPDDKDGSCAGWLALLPSNDTDTCVCVRVATSRQ